MQRAGDRPPKPAGTVPLGRRQPPKTARACAACGEPLPPGSRANKRTHSGACRTRLCRQRKPQAGNACVTGTTATTRRSGRTWAEPPPTPAANDLAPAAAWLEGRPPGKLSKARRRVLRSPSPAQLSLFGPSITGPTSGPRGRAAVDHTAVRLQPVQIRDPQHARDGGSESRPHAVVDAATDAGQPALARQHPPHHRAPGPPVEIGSPLVAALADAILQARVKRSGLSSAIDAKVSGASERHAPARARTGGRSSDAEERGLLVAEGGRR